jgi:hypothetical protein
MIGPQEKADRVLKWLVIGKPGRIGMAVRAYDRQFFDFREKLGGDAALGGIGGEETMGVKTRGHGAQFSEVKPVAGA